MELISNYTRSDLGRCAFSISYNYNCISIQSALKNSYKKREVKYLSLLIYGNTVLNRLLFFEYYVDCVKSLIGLFDIKGNLIAFA